MQRSVLEKVQVRCGEIGTSTDKTNEKYWNNGKIFGSCLSQTHRESGT
jgi:hypothetical protein